MVSAGGDEGMLEIPADKLSEVPGIASQYHDLVGATVSVGVGLRLSLASKALLVAKSRGGDQILLWDDQMQAEVDALTASPKTEADKLNDEYLAKGGGEAPKDKHTGFAGHSTGSKKFGTQGDHDETKVASKVADAAPAATEPPTVAPTAVPNEDFEEQLHGLALGQGIKDQQDDASQATNIEQVKQQVAQTLLNLRSQMPMLAQIKQAAPETYAAIIGLVQGVIALGRQVTSGDAPHDEEPQHFQEAVRKTEDLEKALSQIPPGKMLERKIAPHPRIQGAKIATLKSDYSHLLPKDAQAAGLKLHVEHSAELPKEQFGREVIKSHITTPQGRTIGTVAGHVATAKGTIEPHSHLDDPYHGKGLGTAMYEAVYAHAKTQGINRVSGGVHSPDAHALHTRLAKKHGFKYRGVREADVGDAFYPYKEYSYALKAEQEPNVDDKMIVGPGHGITFHRDELTKDELDKSNSPPSGAGPERHHLNLPVGSQEGEKIKVRHSEGGTGWKSVKEGMIQAQDPGVPLFGANSHPTSSRNPSGH